MQKITKRIFPLIAFFILINSLLPSCKGQEKQLQCYNEELKTLKQQPVYNIVQKTLNDTLQSWINRDLYAVSWANNTEWKIDDAIFFNATFDKAVLLVLKRDTQKIIVFTPTDIRPPTLDYVDLFLAHYENDRWNIYGYSMPSLVIIRKDYGKTEAMSFEELSAIGRKEILLDFYKKGTCTHRENYCEQYDIENFKLTHPKFLDNNSSLYNWRKKKNTPAVRDDSAAYPEK